MKCPMCNGSGKCYEQKIRYQEIETNRTDFTLAKCHKCNGSGEVQMTNEEWLHTLNTEQLAEFLFRIAYMCSYCGDEAHSSQEKMQQCHFGKCGCQRKDWEMWLKQPHQSVTNCNE